jgi:chromosome segregation ATPase
MDPFAPDDQSVEASLERGFIATLRWLVAEGDARGLGHIAVELRALRDALATLDEARAARDAQAARAAELDKALQAAMAVLGPAGNGAGTGAGPDSLLQRLARLREQLAEDQVHRQQLALERDAWRAMCTLLTQTRARVHELLDESEQGREAAVRMAEGLQLRLRALEAQHADATMEVSAGREELAALRDRLTHWSGSVERALHTLANAAGAVGRASTRAAGAGPA